MAYLHCHSCDWSQDDFWSWGYNPFTKIWQDIKWLWKPKWIGLDSWIIEDICKYVGYKAHVRISERPIAEEYFKQFINPPKLQFVKETDVFSWEWLLIEFIKEWKNFRKMRWWTWNEWNKEKDVAVCPKCKDRNFDID